MRFCVRKNLAFRRRKRYTIPSIKIFCIAFLNTFFLNSLVRLISLTWAGGNFWAISWKIASFKLSLLSAICAVEAVDYHYSAIQYVQQRQPIFTDIGIVAFGYSMNNLEIVCKGKTLFVFQSLIKARATLKKIAASHFDNLHLPTTEQFTSLKHRRR